MVSKNRKLFVALLSSFWLRKMLLGCLEQKMFLAKTNKLREQMDRTPYLVCKNLLIQFLPLCVSPVSR
jgi:hypothetical protein